MRAAPWADQRQGVTDSCTVPDLSTEQHSEHLERRLLDGARNVNALCPFIAMPSFRGDAFNLRWMQC
jgi:hypothetical protein